ncbi:MAG: hypothetical protein CM1200mP29_00960 [Verrucomicrobiota bacterium]|nr:MAG: hypothetical protein CM1200mP29_00960 [Verrucomicrobiota bacterium]
MLSIGIIHIKRHPQNFPAGVVRADNWKLLQEFETGKLSLYDQTDDIGETRDLASRYPEKVKSLPDKIKIMAEGCRCRPDAPQSGI